MGIIDVGGRGRDLGEKDVKDYFIILQVVGIARTDAVGVEIMTSKIEQGFVTRKLRTV